MSHGDRIGLKRRCLFLHVTFPDAARELEIVKSRLPDVPEQLAKEVVTVVQSLRKLDLKKSPSIAETIEWVRALTVLGQSSLDPQVAEQTLSLVLKYQGDIEIAIENKKTLFSDAAAKSR